MLKPFYLKCHPDVQTSVVAKKVNLAALQTMNGFLDTIQATCIEGRVVEWPTTIEIEFLVLLENDKPAAKRRRPKEPPTTTSRRRVELTVPSVALRDEIVSSVNTASKRRAIARLERQVQLELAKVLKVAGLPAPSSHVLSSTLGDEDDDEYNYDDWLEDAWYHELELDKVNDPGATFRRRFDYSQQRPRRPKTRYEQSRERFVRDFDWKRHQQLYEEAVRDMEADLATEGGIAHSEKRRQDVIAKILSKVRIAKDSDIDLLEQLIALRRLSLILSDNFDALEMEDMGRMWEDLVIVLTGAREYSTSGSSLHRRRNRHEESGFQFTYGADERLVIHIPIDFRDEELLTELDRNLWDFYNLVGDGLEDLYPSSWMDR
jgi:hypothetical protein